MECTFCRNEGAGVDLRDVQIAARHTDPRTTAPEVAGKGPAFGGYLASGLPVLSTVWELGSSICRIGI